MGEIRACGAPQALIFVGRETFGSRKVISFLPTDWGIWFAKTAKAHHTVNAYGEPCGVWGKRMAGHQPQGVSSIFVINGDRGISTAAPAMSNSRHNKQPVPGGHGHHINRNIRMNAFCLFAYDFYNMTSSC